MGEPSFDKRLLMLVAKFTLLMLVPCLSAWRESCRLLAGVQREQSHPVDVSS